MQIAQKTKKSKNETGKGMVVMMQNVIGRVSAKATRKAAAIATGKAAAIATGKATAKTTGKAAAITTGKAIAKTTGKATGKTAAIMTENAAAIAAGFWKKRKELARQYKFMVKPCLLLAAIYTLAISALLRANYNYRDDLKRVISGRKGWEDYGRYLSNFLSSVIHADSYLTDVSPLPQLIAVLFLAMSGIILWHSLSKKRKISVWDLAALVPLGVSPYFLACISYKYDSPYMALSIFMSVLPILFIERGTLTYLCAVTLGTFLMCATYQASSGIFPMLVLLLCMRLWNQGEDMQAIRKLAVTSAVGYLAGLMIFKLFLMPPSNRKYVVTSLPPWERLIPETATHLAKYFSLIWEGFKQEWLILILCMAAAVIVVMIRDSKRNKFAAAFLSVITLSAMLLLSFGVYPVLSKPLFYARAMYGFGVFISLLGVCISTSDKMYCGKLACLALGWCFFVFSFTYGNALQIQEDYAKFRVEEVLDDLKDMDIMTPENSHEKISIQFSGAIGYAPAIKHMPKDSKIMEQLIPPPLSKFRYNELYQFFFYYKLKHIRRNLPQDSGVDFKTYHLPVLKDTIFHTIRGKDGCILIELK